MRIFLVLALMVAFLAIIFALQNASPVTVIIGFWQITASLALILLLTLGVGLISGLLVSMPTIIQRNWKISRYKRQINQLEADLQATKQDLTHHQQLLAQANQDQTNQDQTNQDHTQQQAWVETASSPGVQALSEADPQLLLSGTVDRDEATYLEEEDWP
ncbi:MAG: lipopolysaccharide assembly LapA domain-containing protein [Leptolyngbyaceae cyanobacterium]